MTEANRMLGIQFFKAQDRLRGGPDPEICAPGYTAVIAGQALDLAGHSQFAGAFYAAFPDLEHVIEDAVADDQKVAVRLVIKGTHRADFMGIPASGKSISLDVIALLQAKDGKVVENRAVFDQMAFMQQIGAA